MAPGCCPGASIVIIYILKCGKFGFQRGQPRVGDSAECSAFWERAQVYTGKCGVEKSKRNFQGCPVFLQKSERSKSDATVRVHRATEKSIYHSSRVLPKSACEWPYAKSESAYYLLFFIISIPLLPDFLGVVLPLHFMRKRDTIKK